MTNEMEAVTKPEPVLILLLSVFVCIIHRQRLFLFFQTYHSYQTPQKPLSFPTLLPLLRQLLHPQIHREMDPQLAVGEVGAPLAHHCRPGLLKYVKPAMADAREVVTG